MKRNLKRNKPFWSDLMISLKTKIFVMGTYYKTLQAARDNADGKNVYPCDNGYIVTKVTRWDPKK